MSKILFAIAAVMLLVTTASAVDVLVYGGNAYGDQYGGRLSSGGYGTTMFEQTLSMDMSGMFKNQEMTYHFGSFGHEFFGKASTVNDVTTVVFNEV